MISPGSDLDPFGCIAKKGGAMARRVAIVGTGQTKCTTRRRDVGMPDLVYEAARLALDDAELGLDDVDAVIYATAPESFDGVNSPDKWAADAAGALNKPFMRIHTGGATGASGGIAGYHHVASGLFDTVLVVALQRIGQTPDAQRVLNLVWDPIFASGMALNLIASVAMRAEASMKRTGMSPKTWSELAAKQSVSYHNNALNNPYAHIRISITPQDVMNSRLLAWPLRLLHGCPRSDGACAMILASEERAKKITRTPAWVLGVAAKTYSMNPGEPMVFDEMPPDVITAYKMAGIDKPRQQIDVIEPYIPFTLGESDTFLIFGLCDSEREAMKMAEAGFGEMTGEIPISPSGGVVCSNPIGATALVRQVEAALQVMGKAERRQVPDVRIAVASGHGGSRGPGSAHFSTMMVLGKEPR